MTKRPRADQELLDSCTELWDLLGRDALATRITMTLAARYNIKTLESLRHHTETKHPLHDTTLIEQLWGIGPVALARIRERLSTGESEQ